MTIQLQAVEFPSAREAIRREDGARRKAILLDGKNLVVSKEDAERLETAGVSFAYLGIHAGRVVTVPVNDHPERRSPPPVRLVLRQRRRRISEESFETKLADLLRRRLEGGGGDVATFADHGVLTLNRGLVVKLPNGQEFQLTIVESTRRR